MPRRPMIRLDPKRARSNRDEVRRRLTPMAEAPAPPLERAPATSPADAAVPHLTDPRTAPIGLQRGNDRAAPPAGDQANDDAQRPDVLPE